MSRKRSISTDMSTDPKLAELAEHGHLPLLLYTWAIPHADDYGRMTGDARQFKLLVCPALNVSKNEVFEALQQIADVGLWHLSEVDGRWIIAFPEDSWYKHQPDLVQRHRRRPWMLVRKKLSPIVFERDGYKCARCGSQDHLQVDHIVPVAHGGGNELENLQTLCRHCNLKKGARENGA